MPEEPVKTTLVRAPRPKGKIRQVVVLGDRLMLVLVRCGNGRFLCPAQDVKHFIGIIEEHARLKQEKTGQPMQGDHVRDVSLPND